MRKKITCIVKRLLKCTDTLANIDMVRAKYPDKQRRYVCYFKYGCDGLSGLRKFNQELDDDDLKDGKMLASHLIILQIVCYIDELKLALVVHQNPLMNSKGPSMSFYLNFYLDFIQILSKLYQDKIWIKLEIVFCYQNCSDLLWEKIVLVIEKIFWNSRLNSRKVWNQTVKSQNNCW